MRLLRTHKLDQRRGFAPRKSARSRARLPSPAADESSARHRIRPCGAFEVQKQQGRKGILIAPGKFSFALQIGDYLVAVANDLGRSEDARFLEGSLDEEN